MDGVDGLASEALKLSQAQDLVRIGHINQMVGNSTLLLRSRLGRADIHPPVEKA
jgi:hypothetical protein